MPVGYEMHQAGDYIPETDRIEPDSDEMLARIERDWLESIAGLAREGEWPAMKEILSASGGDKPHVPAIRAEVVRILHVQGLGYPEIAELLGEPRSVVRPRAPPNQYRPAQARPPPEKGERRPAEHERESEPVPDSETSGAETLAREAADSTVEDNGSYLAAWFIRFTRDVIAFLVNLRDGLNH